MFYLNTIEQLFLFVEQLDQLEVCLPYSILLTGIPILAVFQNLRWNSNKTSLLWLDVGLYAFYNHQNCFNKNIFLSDPFNLSTIVEFNNMSSQKFLWYPGDIPLLVKKIKFCLNLEQSGPRQSMVDWV